VNAVPVNYNCPKINFDAESLSYIMSDYIQRVPAIIRNGTPYIHQYFANLKQWLVYGRSAIVIEWARRRFRYPRTQEEKNGAIHLASFLIMPLSITLADYHSNQSIV
jgi:hypothetical protein